MTAPKGAGGGHTKGPWRIVDREVLEDGSVSPRHIVDANENHVACLEASVVAALAIEKPGSLWDTTEAKEARARLIAAAPELLEACQTFAEWLRREDEGLPAGIERGTPEGEREWRAWFDENLRICALAQEQARAALAKAGGSHG